jgi:RNA polymerase subunit RPABC4/transcription elongation factor Spt4
MTGKKLASAKPESLGRGRKRCPSCGSIVAARAPKCRICGYEFLHKSHKGVVVRRTIPDQATLQKLVEFINSHGGLENAQKIINNVRELVQHVGSLEILADELNLVNLIKQQVQE